MYRYDEVKEVHLEITSKCQAKCPMCPRSPYGGPLNPYIELAEISLDLFKSWFNHDFIKQLNRLFMCGNLGDPVVAKDTLEIFRYLRETNPDITLSMNTNGSARDIKWWQELASLNVRVIFGIDGLEDTHHLYRINTDFQKIIKNAGAFIDAGGVAEWHMLVFKHNEHQVADCENLSKSMGFKNFETKHTSRFVGDSIRVINDQGKTINVIEPTAQSGLLSKKVKLAIVDESAPIVCKVKKSKQIYVGSGGIVSPCCWLDVDWFAPYNESRINYMDVIGKFPNLNDHSLEEIFSSGHFDKIEETWTDRPLKECTKQCGSVDKFGAQFVKQ